MPRRLLAGQLGLFSRLLLTSVAAFVAAASHLGSLGARAADGGCEAPPAAASLAVLTQLLVALLAIAAGLWALQQQRRRFQRQLHPAAAAAAAAMSEGEGAAAAPEARQPQHWEPTGSLGHTAGTRPAPQFDQDPLLPLAPAPLVDQEAGIISPFAAILPLLEPEEDEGGSSGECVGAPPSAPAAAAGPAPAAPAGAAGRAALAAPARSGHLVAQGSLEHQQSLQYAAATATAAAAAGGAGAGGGSGLLLLRAHSSLSSSIGSWVASLLGRGWSAPTEVASELGEEAPEEGPSMQPPPHPAAAPSPPLLPLPLHRRGSHHSLASAGSGGSTASVQSQGRAPLSPPAAAVGLTESSFWAADSILGSLDLSDWEVSPGEIEIMKRPDGSDWELGAGGFGKVYKAMRNGVQPVAVKVLATVSSEAREAHMAEFCHEIAVLRACKDPNIVAFLGACLHDSHTMLVTELCEGGSLTRNILRGKVSWWLRGRKIALDVARGLVFLHSRRVVHFDIKSSNILLTRDGTAKIADVGMAKIMGRDVTAVSGCLGTLAWASPEMLLGARCTEKSDIYSFGVLLWEICTGEMPMRGQLRDVRVPEECPPSVRDLILECLDPSPKARPTALQLVERLLATPAAAPQNLQLPKPARRSADAALAGPRAAAPGRSAVQPPAGRKSAPVQHPLPLGAPARALTMPPAADLSRGGGAGGSASRAAARAATPAVAPPAVAGEAAQGPCIAFSEEAPECLSPFAGAARKSRGLAAPAPMPPAAGFQQAQQAGSEPEQHAQPSKPRPPRPPLAMARAASSDRPRQQASRPAEGAQFLATAAAAATAAPAATAAAVLGGSLQLDAQEAEALRNCPLFSALQSHQAVPVAAQQQQQQGPLPLRRQRSSPAAIQSAAMGSPAGAPSPAAPGAAASSSKPTPRPLMLPTPRQSHETLSRHQQQPTLQHRSSPALASLPEALSAHSMSGRAFGAALPAAMAAAARHRAALPLAGAEQLGLGVMPSESPREGMSAAEPQSDSIMSAATSTSAAAAAATGHQAPAASSAAGEAGASPKKEKDDVWGRILFNM